MIHPAVSSKLSWRADMNVRPYEYVVIASPKGVAI
jgi:hypothetical protein